MMQEFKQFKLDCERLLELNAEIRAYPYWGAKLTALNEERAALRRKLCLGKE